MVGALIFVSFVVVTSNYDLYWIVKQVMDPSIEVYYLVDETVEDPWTFEPQNYHIGLLNRADVFIHTGTFERRWLSEALFKARNPKIIEGKDGHIDLSRWLPPLGDTLCLVLHKEYFKKAGVVISMILRKRKAEFTERWYEHRLTDYFSKIDEFFAKLEEKFSPIRQEKFVLYSPCVGYLVQSLGLSVEIKVKEKEDEYISKQNTLDVSEVMKKMNLLYVLSTYRIEKEAEIGFLSQDRVVIKVPSHLGKNFPTLDAIIEGIVALPDYLSPFRRPPAPQQPPEVTPEAKEIQIPPEKPPVELPEYAFITKRYVAVILRDRPAERAGQAGRIPGGTRVRVVEKQNEWVKVTDGKSIGWVRISVVVPERYD